MGLRVRLRALRGVVGGEEGREWDGGVTYGAIVGLEVGSETGGTLRGWWEFEGKPGGRLWGCWKGNLWLGGEPGDRPWGS